MRFNVDLEIFRGPLDLLLYLVRKHELDIIDIPISLVTEQFLSHIEVLENLDINAVGDFVSMASTLMEIKSRMLLPSDDEVEEKMDDPRAELVERLLAYKSYRDAASILEEKGRDWQQHYGRVANDLPTRKLDPTEQPIHEVELWDLVSAFGRMMREHDAVKPNNIVYDETPIEENMHLIYKKVLAGEKVLFHELFEKDATKSRLVGIFLAILELIRHHYVYIEQTEVFSEIQVHKGTNENPLNSTVVDRYEHGKNGEEEPEE